jgi:hypothetical protein
MPIVLTSVMFYRVGVFSILSLNITPCLVFSMAVVDKRERRLPALLIKNASTNSDGKAELERMRRGLKKLRLREPAVHALLLKRYFDVLEEIREHVGEEN